MIDQLDLTQPTELEATALEEGYYHLNFLRLVDFVGERYDDLLSQEAADFVRQFKAMGQSAQRLYTRLLTRKGPRFRCSKLNYPEIGPLQAALDELAEHGLLIRNPSDELEWSLATLLKAELVELAEQLGETQARRMSKEELLQVLGEYEDGLIGAFLAELDEIIEPLGWEIVALFKLLFFGNLYQDLHEFILENVGVMRFESYPLGKNDRPFQTRKEVEQVFYLIEKSEEHYIYLEEEGDYAQAEAIAKEVYELEPEGAKAKGKRAKILLRQARQWEREKKYDAAFEYYQEANIPPARERQIRILDKLEDFEGALTLCETLSADPMDDSEREFLRHFPEGLKRKLQLPYQKRKREKFDEECLTLERDEATRVEQVVVRYYEEQGLEAFHTENLLWRGLFGLTFWDIIFHPVPGVFYHPYQRGPADLMSSRFRRARESLITQRLDDIRSGNFALADYLNRYDEKYKTANWLVSWKHLTKEIVGKVVQTLPANHLAEVYELLLDGLKRQGSGLPDLIVLDPKEEKYFLAEVKGPGDQLRANQKKWLRHFEEHEIPYRVVKVEWKK